MAEAVSRPRAGLLAEVRDRGTLNCGVNDAVPGFGFVDEAGEFAGFDIDFCRVIAAAVLGDAEAVEFTPLTADQRFTALQSGEIDVLVRNTTWTASRDGGEGAAFATTTFFDGQGMMVPADSGFTTIDELAGPTICVLVGHDHRAQPRDPVRRRRPRVHAAVVPGQRTAPGRPSSPASATAGRRTSRSWPASGPPSRPRPGGPERW